MLKMGSARQTKRLMFDFGNLDDIEENASPLDQALI